MRDALADAVLAGRVAWVLGGLCLLMATIGAFGVFAYAVEHRRREIGIRVALGARGAQIVALVFVMAGRALFCGLAAGFVMTVAAAPILRHLLYGLSPVDPIAYLEVAAVLAAAVGLATWIPTRRAIAIDPATMLRDE